MSDQQKGSATLFIVIIILAVAAAGGYYMYKDKVHNALGIQQGVSSEEEVASETPAEPVTKTVETEDNTAEEGPIEPSPLPFPPAATLSDALPTDQALQARTLGDDNAPIVIIEHSSLSCPHCASFHKETFKKLKTEYVDTGKVKIIFDDFPLNGPALDATMIARCIPDERYFDYVQYLFENQADWAFSQGRYIGYLKQTSQFAGLSPEGFDKCINNEELRMGILEHLADVQRNGEVSSTPTFIFNNGTKITGAQSLDVFAAEIEKIAGTINPDDATTDSLNGSEEQTAEEPPSETPESDVTEEPNAPEETDE